MPGRKIRNNNKNQIAVPYVLFYFPFNIVANFYKELDLICGIELSLLYYFITVPGQQITLLEFFDSGIRLQL